MDFGKIERELQIEGVSADLLRQAFDYFDVEYYRISNPDVVGDAETLFAHYMTQGWRQGRNPNRTFRSLVYLLDRPHLVASGHEPLLHYLSDASSEPEIAVTALPSLQPDDREAALATFALESSIAPIDEEVAFGTLSPHEIAKLRDVFDSAYYLSKNPDVGRADVDPLAHYMLMGWREERDPSPNFSTKFYLRTHADIAASGMNPFVHWAIYGKAEGRVAMSFQQKLDKRNNTPKIAAIVPNFNHAPYLPQRLDSILAQTYPHIEITVLDDCSTDGSRIVIDDYCERYPGRIRKLYNTENSGGVFKQWRKGVESTESELVWICESDDFCEPDFIEKLVPRFADDSVQMAFGRILETDIEGVPSLSLDAYRETAEAGIWDQPLVRPAADWFAHGFGVSNVIANVGGCVFRRSPLPECVWQEAARYRVVGDWYLYIQIASGGQIAWEPDAISYFRRHGKNTSSSSFTGPGFYRELERLMVALRETWYIPDPTVQKFYAKIREQYEWFGCEKEHGPLEDYCSLDRMLAISRRRSHILIAMLGFVPGGGENFPIQLANSLTEAGLTVSMLIFETNEINAYMRAALNPAVSVYDADWITEYGCNRFIQEAGVSLVHSHTIGAEVRFYDLWKIDPQLPYLVTLHGSYEASELPASLWKTITRSVDHFVYTADKNLLPLADQKLPSSIFTKMTNAMPIDPIPFPQTREEMSIGEDAVVFTLVARGIKRKGWRAAIEAFTSLCARRPDRKMHLLMVGTGEEPDRHRRTYGNDPNISFLGYQSRIHGLYRMSDVAVVPTRFVGESYPLCIIQALQVGTPVIGTNVGEIRRMLETSDGLRGGLVVEAVRDTNRFVAAFSQAMEAMLDDTLRGEFAKDAGIIGRNYDMDPLVQVYSDLYAQLIERARPATPCALAA